MAKRKEKEEATTTETSKEEIAQIEKAQEIEAKEEAQQEPLLSGSPWQSLPESGKETEVLQTSEGCFLRCEGSVAFAKSVRLAHMKNSKWQLLSREGNKETHVFPLGQLRGCFLLSQGSLIFSQGVLLAHLGVQPTKAKAEEKPKQNLRSFPR